MENRGGEVERREKHPGRRYGPAGTRPKVDRPDRVEADDGQGQQGGGRRWSGPVGRRPEVARARQGRGGSDELKGAHCRAGRILKLGPAARSCME